MPDQLVGYLLEALDEEESVRVEVMLRSDAEARRRLELLRLALAPLEADRDDGEAPSELAVRTCREVREIRIQGKTPRDGFVPRESD